MEMKNLYETFNGGMIYEGKKSNYLIRLEDDGTVAVALSRDGEENEWEESEAEIFDSIPAAFQYIEKLELE